MWILRRQLSEKIYVINSIGLGAARWLLENRRSELDAYFPHFFMNRAEEMVRGMPQNTEDILFFLKKRCSYAEELGEQGILSALWRMAEELHTGLQVHLRNIPIRQETVEILERFDLNPYYALSSGAFLVVTGNHEMLMDIVRDAGLTCDEIGELKSCIARTVINGESVRYLDRPQKEELDKVRGLPH